jgi:nucleoside-diphosphate-sugar epimerase
LRRAALTGATGFLGLHVLPALARAGFQVRILARRAAAPAAWDGLSYETVHGDLSSPQALQALLQDADLVVHAAGLIKARRPADFYAVNRDGTAALAQAARRIAPQARFLMVSSLAAREPQLSDYAASKRQSEQAAQATFADAAGQLCILRPPAIYGPWDRETLTLFKATRNRFAPVAGHGRTAVVHVQDVAAAIAALAQNWRHGVFALADLRPNGYSMQELLGTMAQATGGTPHLLQLPDTLVLAAGHAAGFLNRLTGQAHIFGAGKAREMLHQDWTVSPAEALPAEIYAPRYTLEQGVADTVAWYRRAGWL